MLMFCLQGNSKVVVIKGILFPNLIKKWLFESLQRPCNILYFINICRHVYNFQDTEQSPAGDADSSL